MQTPTTFPLFQKYTLDELERLVPYAVSYLVNIRDGTKPARRRFRRVVASILEESESELFGADGDDGQDADT